MLKQRREQIALGIANAEKIKAELDKTETQRQEVMAQANSVGEISLALRSIADIPKRDGGETESALGKKETSNSIRILRYGNKSQASSVN